MNSLLLLINCAILVLRLYCFINGHSQRHQKLKEVRGPGIGIAQVLRDDLLIKKVFFETRDKKLMENLRERDFSLRRKTLKKIFRESRTLFT